MITRVLVAVDDSPPSLGAARTAVELAASVGARLRAVNVLRDHVLSDALERMSGYRGVGERRDAAAAGVLGHVVALARASGVEVETVQLEGEPASCILAEAYAWPADLIVIAKSSQQRRAGEPYVGGETANVLEFAEQPVLVVPPRQPE
ncbi:MAG TPA: universal stress protein [Actinomycetes bacterium]|jgi:nucleotide-binding universal stress UspA family protein|nr:universal stress protein [Actinomycetes bacterium]